MGKPGPKPGYKQTPEHVEKRIRRTPAAELTRRLRCGKCGFAWVYDGATGTIAVCPLCGAKKCARNRTVTSRAYIEKNPDRLRAFGDWLANNKKRHSKDSAERVKKTVFALICKSQTPACASCGCDDQRLLEVNHKNGGGGREYAAAKSATSLYRDIAMLRRPVEDLELLCRVCNAKHYLELKYGPLPIEVVWKLNRTTTMGEES